MILLLNDYSSGVIESIHGTYYLPVILPRSLSITPPLSLALQQLGISLCMAGVQ